jgi:hypothetical protein
MNRVEQVDLNVLFNRMSAPELAAYAREGTLPHWFTSIVGVRPPDSPASDGDA